MKTQIDNYFIISEELKINYPNLTEFETLSLAVQIERNAILENGLAVSSSDERPSALEGISIALGFKNSQLDTTIIDVLTELSNKQ